MTELTDRAKGGATLAGLLGGGLVVLWLLATRAERMLAYRPAERLDAPTALTEVEHYRLLAVYVAAALALISLSAWLARRSLLLRALVMAVWTALGLLVGIELAVRVFWTVAR
jgi:hypothetical protein